MINTVPDAALKSHIAFLGKTGSGKSWGCKTIIERLLDRGDRICAIDPTGAWWGLKSSASGKRAGYPVVIFGGRHADFPLSGAHGEALAEIVGTTSTPVIIDTSLLKTSERVRFFADFADALMRKNKGALHLIIDEAHLFAPQGKVSDPQSGAMLHAANNLISLGRSRGLRVMLLSQRPAKLHKDSLTQVETLVVMRLIAPQDRKAVREWIQDNADEAKGNEIISSLAKLKTGSGWVWAPEIDVLEQISFPKIKTYDSSAAPDDDDSGASAVLAPIDRGAIGEKLAKLAEEIAQNDPKALRAHIASLQSQIIGLERERGANSAAPAPSKEQMQAERAAGFNQGAVAVSKRFLTANDGNRKRVAELLREVASNIAEAMELPTGLEDVKVTNSMLEQVRETARKARPTTPPIAIPKKTGGEVFATHGDIKVSGTQQKILDTLWWLMQRGRYPVPKKLLAPMTGNSSKSSGYQHNLGALRSAGIIEYQPGSGDVSFAPGGEAYANKMEDSRPVHEIWKDVLTGPQAQILDVLIQEHPAPVTKERLAERVNQSIRSSGFQHTLGAMRSMGAIDYPTSATVQLTELVAS